MGNDERSHVVGAREERRESRRVAVDYEFAVDVGSWNAFYTGLVKNISSGGVFIATRESHRLGDTLMVRFTFPGVEDPIQARGVVRWIRDGDSSLGHAGVGIQFADLPATIRDRINGYLEDKDILYME